ncbi:hypothetical protein ACJJTC_009081 [Scirpophaga incertulas]
MASIIRGHNEIDNLKSENLDSPRSRFLHVYLRRDLDSEEAPASNGQKTRNPLNKLAKDISSSRLIVILNRHPYVAFLGKSPRFATLIFKERNHSSLCVVMRVIMLLGGTLCGENQKPSDKDNRMKDLVWYECNST